jgi:hypothetical protein
LGAGLPWLGWAPLFLMPTSVATASPSGMLPVSEDPPDYASLIDELQVIQNRNIVQIIVWTVIFFCESAIRKYVIVLRFFEYKQISKSVVIKHFKVFGRINFQTVR